MFVHVPFRHQIFIYGAYSLDMSTDEEKSQSVDDISPESLPFIHAMLMNWDWQGHTLGQPLTLSYTFESLTGSDQFGRVGRQALTAEEQTLMREAMQAWASVANVHFVETTDPSEANLYFATYEGAENGITGTSLPINPPISSLEDALLHGEPIGPVLNKMEVSFNRAYTDGLTALNLYRETMLHELGHVLGLKHPGKYTDEQQALDPTISLDDLGYK
ncbi:MAG: hypothetical protein KDK34_21750, partial [Leptospiraceae bacterium]|nr:hypothetical protein [Leptospiraceae bacterium]